MSPLTEPLTPDASRHPGFLGPYRLVELVGSGGMGEVFLAERAGPDGAPTQVALKRLMAAHALDQDARRTLVNEARIAARLSHPNLVHVFSLEEMDGQQVLVMEYVAGVSLRGMLRELAASPGRLPVSVSAHLCVQALRGLHCAHELRDEQGVFLGLVHRDVSPENVLLGRNGEVKVSDFGIAKLVNAGTPTTAVLRGKAAYAAPEHLRGQRVSRQSDTYSMGVVLEELLRFQLGEASAQHPLQSVIQRAQAPRAEQRFETAEEMAAAIEAMEPLPSPADAARALGELVREVEPKVARARGHALDAEASRPAARRGGRLLALGLLTALMAVAVVGFVLRTPPRPLSVAAPAPALAPPVSTPTVPGVVRAEAAPTVPPAETLPAPLRPRKRVLPAHLAVRVFPWAEVTLDGRRVGSTPMDPLVVEPGDHELVFRNETLHRTEHRRVHLRSGQTLQLKVDLEPR